MDTTPRGFQTLRFEYQDYDSTKARSFSVQESSLATEPKIWIGPDSPQILVNNEEPSGDALEHYSRAHLGHVEARRVRDALTELLGDISHPVDSRIPFVAAEAEGQRRYPHDLHAQQIFVDAVTWATEHYNDFAEEAK